jgi:indolepyruvate ferredoxin oxidoreductase alpha subunit
LDSLQQRDALALLSGDEAVALAAFEAGVKLGTGYPGTPSTEILETFEKLGGRAQWSPNEKVALEVGVGVAFAGARALVTMKHVGLNVAADPLFTVAYTRLDGALIIVSADDPGMASSQNEQDNRRYAVAAGVPMLEPADSQEAYEFTLRAIEISERWQLPVLLRMTTRVCHSKTIVRRGRVAIPPPHAPHFEHDFPSRVMIPAYAKPAHRRLRQRLAEIAAWNDEAGNVETRDDQTGKGEAGNDNSGTSEAENGQAGLNQLITGSKSLGIITSGVAFQHVREVAPEASVLKLGLTYPLPIELMRKFVAGVERCMVIEEGDPYLVEGARTAGIKVEGKPESFRFGELNTARVRRILEGDTTPEPKPAPGKPPALCPGCPHRSVYTALKELDCIVAGDIGCYSLGVLPPFEAMDTLVCMGAAIGVGLGLRHALPPEEARRVVSVLGDSTFVHSGITGLVEMVYNPPPSGHVLIILDNGTTAMTGMQEHPGTGRTLSHARTGKVVFEDLARAVGVRNVYVIDPVQEPRNFQQLIQDCLDLPELSVVIARRDCLLATRSIREYERCNEQPAN